MPIFHLKPIAVILFWKYSVKIQEKRRTKINQEKDEPLLEVFEATRFASVIFTIKFVNGIIIA